MTTFSAIGLHAADDYSIANQNFLRSAIQRLHPAYANILLAQNADQARPLAEELRQSSDTEIMVRHHFGPLGNGDEQTMQRFPSPAHYFTQIAMQYVGSDLILVPYNEITFEAYNTPVLTNGLSYVQWTIQGMRYFHDAGLRGCWLRFPPWHPYREQFSQFDQVVVTYDIQGQNPIEVRGLRHAFALWSEQLAGPNSYYVPAHGGEPENVDSLRKTVEFWQYLGEPLICIGEYGPMAAPGAALDGFRTIGWGEAEAADNMVDMWRRELQPYGIPVCFWHVLKWFKSETMRGNEAMIAQLVRRAPGMQIERRAPGTPAPQPEPPVVIDPPAQPIFVQPTGDRLRVRESAPDGKIVDHIGTADVVRVLAALADGMVQTAKPEHLGQDSVWLQVRTPQFIVGWCAAWFLRAPDTPPVPPDQGDTMLRSEHERLMTLQKEGYEVMLRDKNKRIDLAKQFASSILEV